MKFVVMAGGSGSKLWPYSRVKAPKQFIDIVGERTLFQKTVDALTEKYSIVDVFVSTTEELEHFVEEQTPDIPKENYIIEPMARDTGPASCYAMAKVAARYPDEVVYFYVQSVCTREPAGRFLDMVGEMEKLVKESGRLVTGTIIPKYVETGSDLFKLGNKKTLETKMDVYEVSEFINVVKERMTLEQVTEISKKNVVGTHTNHYTWRPKEFFDAVGKHQPGWLKVVDELRQIFGKPNEKELLADIYQKFEPNRIEVLTTELIKEGKVMAVELPFEWSHITTWDDVYRYRVAKGLPLVDGGDALEVESEGNMVVSQTNKLVTLIGMKDMVIVDTDDALFIAPRHMVGKIKEVTDRLQESKEGLL